MGLRLGSGQEVFGFSGTRETGELAGGGADIGFDYIGGDGKAGGGISFEKGVS